MGLKGRVTFIPYFKLIYLYFSRLLLFTANHLLPSFILHRAQRQEWRTGKLEKVRKPKLKAKRCLLYLHTLDKRALSKKNLTLSKSHHPHFRWVPLEPHDLNTSLSDTLSRGIFWSHKSRQEPVRDTGWNRRLVRSKANRECCLSSGLERHRWTLQVGWELSTAVSPCSTSVVLQHSFTSSLFWLD